MVILLNLFQKLQKQLWNNFLSENQKQKQLSDWYGWDDRTPIQYIAPFQ